MPTISDLARDAREWMQFEKGFSPNTVDGYDRAYRQFTTYLRLAGLPDDVRQFTSENCRGFMRDLARRKVSPNTIIQRLSALSTLARFIMMRTGAKKPLLTHNPLDTFEWPTYIIPDTKYLLADELRAFMSVPVEPHKALCRDVAVETGLRASELCRANVEDLREAHGRHFLSVTVKGRGTRERRHEMPLSPELAEHIRTALLAAGRIGPKEPLLVNREGERWKRTTLSMLMTQIGKEAGITRFRMSAHKLRHTANVIARVAGIDALVRSRLMGHSNPRSLARYDHLVPGELSDARDAQMEAFRKYVGQERQLTDTGPDVQKDAEENARKIN